VRLLNVSYDPTRELYAEINPLFAAHWLASRGQQVVIDQSHGGSGKQARSVIDGIEADVATLALGHDIDLIATKGRLLPTDWRTRLPHGAAPCHSAVVFLVRAGNPKGIRDWDDLVRRDVQVITPNPKTSGGARWNYLAAWGAALRRHGGDQARAEDFVTTLYRNVPVLDTGARGATTTFVERGQGDVLLAWESEALLALKESGRGRVELVVPPLSIRAEPPVAVVEANARRHGTEAVAAAYLEFLFSPPAQAILARHGYRPIDPAAAASAGVVFPAIDLFTVDDLFGGWAKAHAEHFASGATFDRIALRRR
jgi:sulfate transport system substrate-binding protein